MSPRRSHRLAVFVLLCMTTVLSACSGLPARPSAGAFVAREVVVDGSHHRYQMFVPSRHAGGAHPATLLFLHGSGERGDDGVKPTLVGLGPYVRAHADTFPAIVVFPQAAEDGEWYGTGAQLAFAALDAASREFGGDADRTYLTGLSMGGFGVWELALMQPQRFAALVPICGAVKRLDDERELYVTSVADDPDPYATIAGRLRDVPTWIFHGAKDDDVPLDDDRRLIAALRAADARDARYTEFPDANHNAWDPAYAQTPALWDWLFAQRRR
jgi:predicted peptidase